MFCPMCGAPNEEEATYCANCGAALAADLPPLEPPPEEPEGSAELEGPMDVISPVEPVAPIQAEEPVIPLPPRPPTPSAPPRASSTASAPVNGMAVASLVLGIAGLTVLPVICSVFAIIFGYMARRDIRQRPAATSGNGVAVAGIVLGWIGVGLLILGVLGIGGAVLCGLCGALGIGV